MYLEESRNWIRICKSKANVNIASTEKRKTKVHEKSLINKLKCSPNVVLSGLGFIALGTTLVHKHHQNICFMNFDRWFMSHII